MADNILLANNASALLAASINTTDTTIQVASGFGANFPSPTGAQYFLLTLEDSSGNIEIVKITGRTGDNLTMDSAADRAQDGTTAQSFTLNTTRCELRITAAVIEEFLQKNGGTMTGAIDMNGLGITDAVLSGANTKILAGEIVNVPLRGLTTATGNEIVVPTDGTTRATAGGASILASGDDIVAELDSAGVITLDSATVGVVMDQDGAYFRMQGVFRVAHADVAGDYLEIDHDDTDVNFTFVNTAEVNWDAILNMSAAIKLGENEIQGATFVDFGVKKQDVTATSTTAIDYTAGQYVNINLNVSITTLSVTNLPSTGVASLRFEILQNTGGQTIDFDDLGVMKWPGGTAPTLSTGAADIDFVDLWTRDGGTTWYGSYNNNWE